MRWKLEKPAIGEFCIFLLRDYSERKQFAKRMDVDNTPKGLLTPAIRMDDESQPTRSTSSSEDNRYYCGQPQLGPCSILFGGTVRQREVHAKNRGYRDFTGWFCWL